MQRGEVFRRSDRPGWIARWYDKGGKRHTKGGWKTKAEAATFLDDLLKQQRLGVLYRPDRTFNDLVAEYLKHYTVVEASQRNMKYGLAKAQGAFGGKPLHEITPLDITALKASIPLPHARWRTIRAVKQVLAEARRWGWISIDPARDIKNPQPPAPSITPFETWSEIEAIADEIELFPEIPELAAGTGLMPEEWSALQKRDIDLKEGVLYAQRVWVGGEEKEYGKNAKRRRRIPLRRRLVKLLRPVMAELEEDTDPLFPGERSKYLWLPAWRRDHWHPAVEAAGLLLPDGGRRRLYDLRHTYASFSLAADVSVFALARRMGTSVRMIERTYGHLLKDADAVERKLLDKFDSHLG